MRDELFEELKQSIKQGGKILKGKRKPSREFSFKNPDPKQIRERLGLSQNKDEPHKLPFYFKVNFL